MQASLSATAGVAVVSPRENHLRHYHHQYQHQSSSCAQKNNINSDFISKQPPHVGSPSSLQTQPADFKADGTYANILQQGETATAPPTATPTTTTISSSAPASSVASTAPVSSPDHQAKDAELAGKLSEKLQSLLRQTLEVKPTASGQALASSNHDLAGQHFGPISQDLVRESSQATATTAPRTVNEAVLEELMKKWPELRNSDQNKLQYLLSQISQQQEQLAVGLNGLEEAGGLLSRQQHQRNNRQPLAASNIIHLDTNQQQQQQQQYQTVEGIATLEQTGCLATARHQQPVTLSGADEIQQQLELQQAARLAAEFRQTEQIRQRLLAASVANPRVQHYRFLASPTDSELTSDQLIGQHFLSNQDSQTGCSQVEHYLLRQHSRQQQLAMDHLRTISSCSSHADGVSSSNGRHSSMGLDHCFLESFDLMSCATSSSSPSTTSCSGGGHSMGAGSITTSPSMGSQQVGGGIFSNSTRLNRRLRFLESPTDSGIDSGRENGAYSALGFSSSNSSHSGFRSSTPNAATEGGFSSACMSPINGLSSNLLYGHRQLHQLTTAANSQQHQAAYRYLNLEGEPPVVSRAAPMARPVSAMSSHPARPCARDLSAQSASASHSGSIDDMPMLKRALQAPPLINTNMLMDEAYRHHKKFRAAQRKGELAANGGLLNGQDCQQIVGSTSGTSSSASNHLPMSSGCPSACVSPAPSPSPDSSGKHSSSSVESTSTTNTTTTTSPPTSNSSTSSSSSLANMHSTLLEKLNQPSNVQMSQQQLTKCNDLIHEIILRDEQQQQQQQLLQNGPSNGIDNANPVAKQLPQLPNSTGSPIPSGAVAPASSPISISSSQANSSSSTPTLQAPSNNNNNNNNDGVISGSLEKKFVGSNLHRILVSGQQKQLMNAVDHAGKVLLEGGANINNMSHLVDEDYITKRLLNSGAYRRHQQQHRPSRHHHHHHHHHHNHHNHQHLPSSPHGNHRHSNQTPGAHNHHRPSSSCACSSSPSPTSSLSTLSPSPTSSLGGFGLLADVAIAAAEEQSRLERLSQQQQQLKLQHQQQQLAEEQLVTSAQPMDLSKK